MAKRPIVLVHGYSDRGESFKPWRDLLSAHGFQAETIQIGNYVSLSNEVTIKDIAEGFDRALRQLDEDGILAMDDSFDVIVHSTAMLVVREWLVGIVAGDDVGRVPAERQARLKHLIGLAPATFGSPMAHKGRSWMGAIFKGGKQPGPDFMEAGNQVLRGLELGSSYTWDLSHRDFLADPSVYGRTSSTPYPFIFVGVDDYGWLKRAVTEPGTDGTVRWAGVGFNSRKIKMDLTVEPTRRQRITIEPWKNAAVPQVFVAGVNHSTILREPPPDLVEMVVDALAVSSANDYEAWSARHMPKSRRAAKDAGLKRWQQFIVHATDERGDGIPDYYVELGTVADGRFKPLEEFSLDVHPFREDNSYRCFHADLDRLGLESLKALAIRIIASSGTELVGYQGYHSTTDLGGRAAGEGKWDAYVKFDSSIGAKEVAFFFPYTTTLIEMRLNREPMPLLGVNRVFWFLRATPEP